jgi:shikimate kinase
MPLPGETRTRKCICLTGFMGSGKTTVGRLLARQLGWPFYDLDSQIEERSGLTIPRIFERFGEPQFRDMEYEMLARALGQAAEQNRAAVIALGGGTIAQPRSFALVREHQCVLIWLECPIEELLARCATISNRPLFRDEASFRALYEQRKPVYEQADYRVASTGDPRAVVAQLLALDIFERVTA